MSKYEVRLGAKLVLDDAIEMDLINVAERLNSTRKMSEFMTSLFRVACDSLNKYSNADPDKFNALVDMVSHMGVSNERSNYFKSLNEELSKMKTKVDEIYDMALKTYSLAQINKMNGLAGKSENTALAQFALQKQIRDIEKSIGAYIGAYESDKLLDMKKKADDIIEYIIESYDGIGEAFGIVGNNVDVKGYESRIEELEKQLADMCGADNEEVGRLNSKLRLVTGERDTLNMRVKSLENELKQSSESGTAELQNDIERLNKEVKDLRSKNNSLKRKIKALTEDYLSDTDDEDTDDNTDNGIVDFGEQNNTPADFSESADISSISNFFGE